MRLIKRLWRLVSTPAAHWSLGALAIIGFVAGVLFWGGFNWALALSNTEEFCISCHEMEANVYAELQQTPHWINASGVRATCPDCHVPHDWMDKIVRKVKASKEVYGHIFGVIETRQEFVDHRKEMAMREWDRMQANNSQECRNCHAPDSMDLTEQSPRAADFHKRLLLTGERTCIDCHKGIAHELPDMSGVPNWM